LTQSVAWAIDSEGNLLIEIGKKLISIFYCHKIFLSCYILA
jgi:hypothetical protein